MFDGDATQDGVAVVVGDGLIEAIRPIAALPGDLRRIDLDGGLLAPGFVDIQVNGGGGVLVNETPSVESVRAICETHRRYGSTALLPTVITDHPEVTFAAIEAVGAAMQAGIPGCVGVHVGGPFISVARKGAHDPSLIRKMTDADVDRLVATTVRPLLLTVAPESVSNDRIARLAAAGILVSLGHSDADFATATAAFEAGTLALRCVISGPKADAPQTTLLRRSRLPCCASKAAIQLTQHGLQKLGEVATYPGVGMSIMVGKLSVSIRSSCDRGGTRMPNHWL